MREMATFVKSVAALIEDENRSGNDRREED
jgi:hypothetical protein